MIGRQTEYKGVFRVVSTESDQFCVLVATEISLFYTDNIEVRSDPWTVRLEVSRIAIRITDDRDAEVTPKVVLVSQ